MRQRGSQPAATAVAWRVLDALWIASAAPAVDAALTALARPGPIAVLTAPRLARALTHRGWTVTAVDADQLSATASYAAVIGVGPGDRSAFASQLGAWSAATVDGGGVVLIDRGPATESSRRILCAGLTGLEQRLAGRWVVTSGVVSRL